MSRYLVIPFQTGVVDFSTDEYVTIQGEYRPLTLLRDAIVGRQPERGEQVLVLDLEQLRKALKGRIEVTHGT